MLNAYSVIAVVVDAAFRAALGITGNSFLDPAHHILEIMRLRPGSFGNPIERLALWLLAGNDWVAGQLLLARPRDPRHTGP